MTVPSLHFRAPPVLRRFALSDAPLRVVVGPLGSGKSSACINEIFRRACQQKPSPIDGIRRTRFAVVRNTYRELRDTTRRTFEEWASPLGEWHETDFEFHAQFGDVKCEILFRSLDKPADVKKLLSLELTGAYLNEIREIGKHILDPLTARVGRYPSIAHGGPTWSGIWADSNPWYPGHYLDKLFKAEPAFKLFRQPGGRTPEAENVRNLRAGYYPNIMLGKSSAWIDTYVDGKDQDSAEGSIFGAWIAALRKRGNVCDFKYDGRETFVSWDIGVSDSTALFWWSINDTRDGVDVWEWYQHSGEGFPYYANLIESKPYKVARHFYPHDIRQRTWATGLGTIEQVIRRWGSSKVAITPEISRAQGIDAGRYLLEQPGTRFHSRCDLIPKDGEYSGLETLAEYTYSWDELRKIFSKEPLHNFASHTGDCWRYVACAFQQSEINTRLEAAPQPLTSLESERICLDGLWEDHEEHRSDRERI